MGWIPYLRRVIHDTRVQRSGGSIQQISLITTYGKTDRLESSRLYGSMSLSVATRNEYIEMVEYPSIHSINFDVGDNFRQAPVYWAVKVNNLHLV